MRKLQMIMALIFALSLTACAHKMPKSKHVITWPSLPGWTLVDNSDNRLALHNPATTANITLILLDNMNHIFYAHDPEATIMFLYKDLAAQQNFLIELSRIEFSRDGSTAYFSFSRKPNKEGDGVRKGKIVVLLVPGWPEKTAVCVGAWPASAEEQMMIDFDRFWTGIGSFRP